MSSNFFICKRMRLILSVVNIYGLNKKMCAYFKESILVPFHCTAHFSHNTLYQRMTSADVGNTVAHGSVV